MRRSGFATLVAGMLIVTSCSNVGIDPHNNDYAAYNAEYQVAKQSLPLPEGASWPEHIRDASTAGNPVTYEKGAGATDAQFFWLCHWAQDYLRHASDQGSRAALTELKKMRSMQLWTDGIDDQLRTMLDQALTEAELGGSSTWQQLFGQETCVV